MFFQINMQISKYREASLNFHQSHCQALPPFFSNHWSSFSWTQGSRKPRTPSWSVGWVDGAQSFGPSSTVFQGAPVESCTRTGVVKIPTGAYTGCQHHRPWLNPLHPETALNYQLILIHKNHAAKMDSTDLCSYTDPSAQNDLTLRRAL